MATGMESDELEAALAGASEEASYSYRHEEATDNYVDATLYRTTGGRAFRLITGSGFDSPYMGAGNVGEWLSADEEARWSDFGQGDGPEIISTS